LSDPSTQGLRRFNEVITAQLQGFFLPKTALQGNPKVKSIDFSFCDIEAVVLQLVVNKD
jgi:hypothetical protein